jgi:hypothetical protein
MQKKREASSVGEVVDQLMSRLRPGEIDERAVVADAWRQISDTPMLRFSRVGGFLRGVVTVEVSSPPLCSQLAGFRARALLDRLREKVGSEITVRDIRFIHANTDPEVG